MKFSLFFLLGVFWITLAPSQIFHENFEYADSVIYSGSVTWEQNNRLYTSGSYSDSASIQASGDNAYMTTSSFSTVGFNAVFLYFNHICKIEFFDSAILEVSTDGGITWQQLIANVGSPWGVNNCYYFGTGLYGFQNSRFQEASYTLWQPGMALSPDSSWWIREAFDLSPILLNVPNAKLRFSLSDANNTGGNGRAGWFIDDILISDSLDLNLLPLVNRITGEVYVDLNSNQTKDTGEPPVTGLLIESTTSNWATFTFGNGAFQLHLPDTGNIIIQPGPFSYPNTYYSVLPPNHSAIFTGFQQTDSLNDFALQPNGVIDDISVRILTATNFFRPGGIGSYVMIYNNYGTTYQNPTLVLNYDTALTYVSSSPFPPSSVTSDSIVWNLTNLPPLFQGFIQVNFAIDTTLAFGSGIYSNCLINSGTGDFDPSNNVDSVTAFAFAGYDPNAITVTPEIIYSPDLANPPALNYTIYFQNTGNDTAFYVRVNNVLPLEVDMSTYELISTSHDVALNYNPATRLMQYIFNNILLPDSTTNEAESHGYISFRIKPVTTLGVNDSIKSTADIYFDYNLAVTTNAAITTIEDPLSLNEGQVEKNKLQIFPNPVIDKITVFFNADESNRISINLFNIYGQKVKTMLHEFKSKGIQQQIFNVSELQKGVYLIQFENGSTSATAKFLKM